MTGASYSVFFAFAFDAATRPMYRRIIRRLKRHYGNRFNFILGNRDIIEPSHEYVGLGIEIFKNQNSDMLAQFANNIRTADIIVADLTHNNPNVHVELGIAITLNKNILRVSSRNIVEVGSDVKGYEVNFYSSAPALFKMIDEYLEMFLRIKDMPLDSSAGALYGVKNNLILQPREPVTVAAMRDGVIRAKFSFISAGADDDWFGIFLRNRSQQAFAGGYLLYIRRSGSLEFDEMPSGTKPRQRQLNPLALGAEHLLECTIDGSHFEAHLNDSDSGFICEDLTGQSFGIVRLCAWDTLVRCHRVETVCRDTIASTSS